VQPLNFKVKVSFATGFSGSAGLDWFKALQLAGFYRAGAMVDERSGRDGQKVITGEEW